MLLSIPAGTHDWLAARKQQTGQSSNPEDTESNFGNHYMAVDGNKNNDFDAGSCARTSTEDYPWWAVKLEFDTYVEKVRITTSADKSE